MRGVTVVIVSWNTRRLLRDCLRSVSQGSGRPRIIVVDNGSSDGSVEMCSRLFLGVRVIRNVANLGFGAACNQGIQASETDLVLLLNSDTVVPAGTLARMVDSLSAVPSAGVVGCRVVGRDGRRQSSCMRFPNLRTVLVERLLLYRVSSALPRTDLEPPLRDVVGECDWVLGACMLWRKAALEAAGLFDPGIWMYGEELELCYRAKKKDWKVLFEPRAQILHVGGASWKSPTAQTALKMSGLLFFFKRHHSRGACAAVRALTAAGAMIRLAGWTFLSVSPGLGGEARAEIQANAQALLAAMGADGIVRGGHAGKPVGSREPDPPETEILAQDSTRRPGEGVRLSGRSFL